MQIVADCVLLYCLLRLSPRSSSISLFACSFCMCIFLWEWCRTSPLVLFIQVQAVCTYRWRQVFLLANHWLFLWRQVSLQTHTRPTRPRQETMTTLTLSPTLPTPALRHIKEVLTERKRRNRNRAEDRQREDDPPENTDNWMCVWQGVRYGVCDSQSQWLWLQHDLTVSRARPQSDA